jgi:Protein of unknown function (DUF3592)
MSRYGSDGWFQVVVFSALLVWILSVQIPYLLKYLRRKNWPSADGTIQKGAMGRISRGKGFIPACFIGYAFKVQGERYGAYFVLVGNENTLHKVNEDLTGTILQIHYDPSDPNTSLLVDYRDFRFAGLTASQDPDWLRQAPAFDLQDAIRG